MKISVIMPAHRADTLFERSVQSIFKSDYEDFELIIVADGNDNIPQIDGCITLFVAENRGPAFARNLGASVAKGEILYFTDSDVELKTDTLTKVCKYFENETNIAMIGSYDDEPNNHSYISKFKNLSHHFVHQNAEIETNTFWGACGAIRKSVFDSLNGFDAEIYNRPCIEDIELGYRLSEAGFKIQIQKDIQVKHLKKWTLYSFLKTDLMDRAIPWTILLSKYKTLNHNKLNLNLKNKLNAILVLLSMLVLVLNIWLSVALLFIFVIFNYKLFYFLSKKGVLFSICSVAYLSLHYLVAMLGFVLVKILGTKYFESNHFK